MEKLKKGKSWCWLLGALFIFVLFYYITVRTPLAGDDWGYAVNGMSGNPFVKAWEFYFTWSGRYFAELWGFIVAPRKGLWNFLNPALFAGIYVLLYQIVNPKRNPLSVAVLIAAMMLTVADRLRMETYTWIMGTTYVVPLFLILLVIWMMKNILFSERKIKKGHYAALILLNFYIGLAMENCSAASILLNLLMLLYAYFKRKDALKLTGAGLVVSVLGFALIRMSPGAAFRLARDNQAWIALGLFGQIQQNWGNFLNYTFIANKYMMLILSLITFLALIHHWVDRIWMNKKDKLAAFVQGFILTIAIVACFAPTFVEKMNLEVFSFFYDLGTPQGLIFCSIFYILYIANLFWILFTLYQDEERLEKLMMVMMAGTCNLAMLLSPIYGPRSSLYTVYFIILLTASVASKIKISSAEAAVILICFSGMCLQRSLSWKRIYTQVAQVQTERESILQYYREHPEDDEAWIPRMPEESIHSADIEEGDTYHQNSFREYYGLPETTKLVFYKKQ